MPFFRHFTRVVGLAVAAAIVVGPIAWTLIESFKSEEDLISSTPVWLFAPTLEPYRYLLVSGSSFLPGRSFVQLLLNSFVVAGSSSIAAVLLSLPLAFLISRVRSNWFSRFSTPLLYLSFAFRMVPQFSIAIPLLNVYRTLGLTDTLFGLILLYSVLNLSITLPVFSGAFSRISPEVNDAALLDGCSQSTLFLRIAIGSIAANIFSALPLAFLLSWNELPYARILTRSDALTAPVGVLMMIPPPKDFDAEVFQFMGSVAIFQILPAMILVLLLRRFVLRAWEDYIVD